MPRGDGTGPPPDGEMQRGGRMKGDRPGAGPGGNCVCPGCGHKIPHEKGIPCYNQSCPNCGTRMVRE